MPLDMTGFKLLHVGGYWRHVNHARKLATEGWSNRGGAIRNKNGYASHALALRLMAERYAGLYPA